MINNAYYVIKYFDLIGFTSKYNDLLYQIFKITKLNYTNNIFNIHSNVVKNKNIININYDIIYSILNSNKNDINFYYDIYKRTQLQIGNNISY